MEEVEGFLARFHEHDSVDDVFTNGCCYWFAIILACRFAFYGAEIMYDEVENHFGTMVNGRVFDVTGDVTDKFRWVPWKSMSDTLLTSRIVRDCINF